MAKLLTTSPVRSAVAGRNLASGFKGNRPPGRSTCFGTSIHRIGGNGSNRDDVRRMKATAPHIASSGDDRLRGSRRHC